MSEHLTIKTLRTYREIDQEHICFQCDRFTIHQRTGEKKEINGELFIQYKCSVCGSTLWANEKYVGKETLGDYLKRHLTPPDDQKTAE